MQYYLKWFPSFCDPKILFFITYFAAPRSTLGELIERYFNSLNVQQSLSFSKFTPNIYKAGFFITLGIIMDSPHHSKNGQFLPTKVDDSHQSPAPKQIFIHFK